MMESLISDYMLQVSGAGVVNHSRILAFVSLTTQLRQNKKPLPMLESKILSILAVYRGYFIFVYKIIRTKDKA